MAGCSRRVHSASQFRVASISKTLTAACVLHLVEQGKITLEDIIFGPKGILKQFRPTSRGDKRMLKITVRHLLQHSAGWDRDKVGDAVFWNLDKVSPWVDATSDAANERLVKFIMTKKLQFSPGKRHSYSNLGYLILGLVVTEVTGVTYNSYVTSLMEQIGITTLKVGNTKKVLISPDEVEYFNNREPHVQKSIFQGEGTVLPQYGSFSMENTSAYGGWVASALDIIKMLHALDSSDGSSLLTLSSFAEMTKAPKYSDGTDWYGLGIDVQDGGKSWGHTGAMEGTSCTMMRHKSGISWVFLMNAWSRDSDLDGLIKFALSTVECWPLWYRLPSSSSDMFEVLSEDGQQLVQLRLPHTKLEEYLIIKSSRGFVIRWINACTDCDEVYFNIVMEKDTTISYFKTDVRNDDLQMYIDEAWEKAFVLGFAEIYQVHDKLLHVLVFYPGSVNKNIFYSLVEAKRYLELIKTQKEYGYYVTLQSVICVSGKILVSAIFKKNDAFFSISWLQIFPEDFVFELKKQIKAKNRLLYVKFFSVNSEPYVSGVWLSDFHGNCYQRNGSSVYGFLYELRNSALLNTRVQCLSAYHDDGITNYAAVWSENTAL
ncbi:uncharacterized protein LOC121381200 isoform X2 [Gigantopelta aegis]|nr:uncharacterized protein LOC121381200 isoform X2 [Gigantopelta aegis]